MADIKWINEMVSEPRVVGDGVLLELRGEIDLHNSPDVRSALLSVLEQYQPKRLMLSLGQVSYMDSSAIAVLVEALQKLRRTGGRIVLLELQPRVRGLLEIARLDTLFPIAANEEDALKK